MEIIIFKVTLATLGYMAMLGKLYVIAFMAMAIKYFHIPQPKKGR